MKWFGYIARLSQWGGVGYFTRSNGSYLTSLRLDGGGGVSTLWQLYKMIAMHNTCFHWYEGPNSGSLCGTGKLGKDDLKAYALCFLILFVSMSYVNIFRMSFKYFYSSYPI